MSSIVPSGHLGSAAALPPCGTGDAHFEVGLCCESPGNDIFFAMFGYFWPLYTDLFDFDLIDLILMKLSSYFYIIPANGRRFSPGCLVIPVLGTKGMALRQGVALASGPQSERRHGGFAL